MNGFIYCCSQRKSVRLDNENTSITQISSSRDRVDRIIGGYF